MPLTVKDRVAGLSSDDKADLVLSGDRDGQPVVAAPGEGLLVEGEDAVLVRGQLAVYHLEPIIRADAHAPW